MFDGVRLKNMVEGYSEIYHISTEDECQVIVNGYAIQASEVTITDGLDDISEGDLLRIYDVYLNQNVTSTDS